MNASTPLRSNHSRVVEQRKPGRPKFGASTPMPGFLPMLERQPLAELLFKDVFAFNAPKIALARTWKERMDTIPLELSNTTITLFSSLLLPGLVRKGVSAFSKINEAKLKKEIPYAKMASTSLGTKLGRLGVSFGFFFPFAAAFWAAPFARNWLTLKRTNTADFESLIGFEGVQSKRSHRSVEEEMAHQKRRAWQVFGTGVALGVASLLSFGGAAKLVKAKVKGDMAKLIETKGRKPIEWLFNNFDLKGKDANQIEGRIAQLVFWGLPAYLGWVHAARSDNERRERVLQSANALFWFFAAPKLTSLMWSGSFVKLAGKKEYWDPKFIQSIEANVPGGKLASEDVKNAAFLDRVKNLKYEDIPSFIRKGAGTDQAALTSLKNQKFAISGLAVPITALSAVQLINFDVTERKITKQTQQSPSLASSGHSHSAPFNRPYPRTEGSYSGYNNPVFYQGNAYAHPVSPSSRPTHHNHQWPPYSSPHFSQQNAYNRYQGQ